MAEAGWGAVSAAFLDVAPTSYTVTCWMGCRWLWRCLCRTDFEKGASPRRLPQCSKREAVRSLSHRNVLRLAAWPGYGVLAYERGDGGSLRDQKLLEMC